MVRILVGLSADVWAGLFVAESSKKRYQMPPKVYQRPPKRHPKLRKFVEDDVFEYGYNWPYDYFSLVELIKIDASLDFKKQGSTNLGDASISEEDRRKIAEKLNITLKSGEDVDIIPKGDPTLG